MSSTKVSCVIWAAKGCEEMHRRKTRVRSREYAGTLLSALVYSEARWHRGYLYLFVLDRISIFLSRAFLFSSFDSDINFQRRFSLCLYFQNDGKG